MRKPKSTLRWSLMKEITPEGCWLYTGVTNNCGYGVWRSQGVHRISLENFLGRKLEKGECALHKSECTSRRCFNPEHLYVGTQSQNRLDAIKAGTAYSGFTTYHKQEKLNKALRSKAQWQSE